MFIKCSQIARCAGRRRQPYRTRVAAEPDTLRARAARYRAKADELRFAAVRLSDPKLREDFLGLASDYEDMATQLDAVANDHR